MKFEVFKTIVPLLVALLTAALTGYVAPRVTKDWQDYQKELEIKTSIVENASVEVMNILLAIQFAERRQSSQEDFNKAYRTWEVQRAVLLGKIRVYFPDQSIAHEFEQFSDAVTDFYALAGIRDVKYRATQIVKLKSYFGDSATDWTLLEDQEKHNKEFFNWFFAWWKLRQEILARKDNILSKLLAQPISFLRSSALVRFSTLGTA